MLLKRCRCRIREVLSELEREFPGDRPAEAVAAIPQPPNPSRCTSAPAACCRPPDSSAQREFERARSPRAATAPQIRGAPSARLGNS